MSNKKRILKENSGIDLNIMGVNIPLVDFRYTYYWFLALDLSKIYDGSNVPQINNKNILPLKFPLPPLPEQHRIVAKIEELFSELDNGIANLEKARAQLKVYRQAVLKSAFEGKLTEQWRAGQMAATEGSPVPNDHEAGTGTLPSAEDLLTRIQKERQNHYEQQLAEWREAVAEWEANEREGRKPSKPKKPNEYSPLTEKELGELPELPVGWKWFRIGILGSWSGGGTPSKRKKEFWENGMILWVTPKDMKRKIIDDTIDKITPIGRVCNLMGKQPGVFLRNENS